MTFHVNEFKIEMFFLVVCYCWMRIYEFIIINNYYIFFTNYNLVHWPAHGVFELRGMFIILHYE